MRLTRVYLPPPLATGAAVEVPSGVARHLVRVLRLGQGDPLRAFDGTGGEYDAVIESVRRNDVVVRIGAHYAIERESPLDITLLQGIARGEKMDLVLQKATELGVTRIVPVTSLRSNVRLTRETAAARREHWQAVVASACGQCGRNRVPQVAGPVDTAGAVQYAAQGLKLVLVPGDDARDLRALLAEAGGSGAALPPVTLLVGPEGGLDPSELRVARLAGFAPCVLGPRILRTETAALVALAALQFAAGDLAGQAPAADP
jgi:16S rRNA (uracil1498-N3)-methyltransferase